MLPYKAPIHAILYSSLASSQIKKIAWAKGIGGRGCRRTDDKRIIESGGAEEELEENKLPLGGSKSGLDAEGRLRGPECKMNSNILNINTLRCHD